MPEVKSPFPRSNISLRKKTAIRILLKSVVYAFAIFGILFILLLFAVLGMVRTSTPAPIVPQKAVLTVDFDANFPEVAQDSLLFEMAPSSVGQISFYQLLTALSKAAKDDRIKALAGRINVTSLGLAQIQELRKVIEIFKNNGKQAYIYSPGLGSFGEGTDEYYLASAFSEITMQPNSDVGVTGISAEVPFIRGALDKIGVTPEFYTRYEHKTAMATFMDKQVSPVFKADMNFLIAQLNVMVMQDLLKSRFSKPTKEDFLGVMDKAPFSAEYAKTIGLIDEIAYEGDWIKNIMEKYQAEPVSVEEYAVSLYPNTKGKKLAVIFMEGMISDVPGVRPLEGAEINSRLVLGQVDEIKQDKDIKGVLVRINSPGGSYGASAEIWNALNRLKQENKIPLVISMGDYAASGGYMVALAGDKIFADAATLTGSIGVLGGKFVLEDLWKKLDVNWEAFDPSENAGILSPNFKFNKTQKSAFNNALDRVYEDFTLKVSEARNIPLDQLDKLARGRVFLGQDAAELGLVDEVGGLDVALGELKARAKMDAAEPMVLVTYPKPKTLQEKISELLGAAPVVSVKATAQKLGLDISSLTVLKHFKYDAIMLPMIFNM